MLKTAGEEAVSERKKEEDWTSPQGTNDDQSSSNKSHDNDCSPRKYRKGIEWVPPQDVDKSRMPSIKNKRKERIPPNNKTEDKRRPPDEPRAELSFFADTNEITLFNKHN